MMKPYEPPFTITAEIMDLCVRLSELSGSWKSAANPVLKIKLRRENRIKTIHSSLAIEGNSLSLDQVTSVLEGKKVLGPAKDLLEVKNAIQVYELLDSFTATSEKSFLKAHQTLMRGLVKDAGKYRSGQVGILKGSKVSHVAPPAKWVPSQVNALFAWIKKSKLNAFVKSCVVHYEIEFIHPFMDGNGRIGRLWQTLILKDAYPFFAYLPAEDLIRKNQAQYYQALEASDKAGDAAPFVIFMLKILLKTMDEYFSPSQFEAPDAESRLLAAKQKLWDLEFARIDYQRVAGAISSATASRDLQFGVEEKILKMTGEKRTARYRFR